MTATKPDRYDDPEPTALVLFAGVVMVLQGMLSALAPLARPLLLTQAPGRRAATVGELAEAARQAGVDAPVLEPEITTALERAWSMGQTIAAAGSLYLAGAVLARVEGY